LSKNIFLQSLETKKEEHRNRVEFNVEIPLVIAKDPMKNSLCQTANSSLSPGMTLPYNGLIIRRIKPVKL